MVTWILDCARSATKSCRESKSAYLFSTTITKSGVRKTGELASSVRRWERQTCSVPFTRLKAHRRGASGRGGANLCESAQGEVHSGVSFRYVRYGHPFHELDSERRPNCKRSASSTWGTDSHV